MGEDSDSVARRVRREHHLAGPSSGVWQSSTIVSRGRWTVVLRAAGRIEYQCVIAPSMKGTVVV